VTPARFARSLSVLRWLVAAVVMIAAAAVSPAVPASASPRGERLSHQPVSPVLVDLPDLLSRLLTPGQPLMSDGAPALPPDVLARVASSTVRVTGVACNARLFGSGFAAEPGVVVTAAHVVAGVTTPEILLNNGRRARAEVVAFDPRSDLAVLRAGSVSLTPLPLAGARVGDEGAVFGHPGGQRAVEVSPARFLARGVATTRDIYDEERVRREVVVLGARLQPAESGGPVVDRSGAVVGVAYGVALNRPATVFAVAAGEVSRLLSQAAAAPVSTGRCAA
jgi:S1-C subfamily serine protease